VDRRSGDIRRSVGDHALEARLKLLEAAKKGQRVFRRDPVRVAHQRGAIERSNVTGTHGHHRLRTGDGLLGQLNWGRSGAQIAAMEIRDIVQLAFAAAGWGLAAFQYWRNELTKRPLVLMEIGGVVGDPMIGITIRNRGPTDIYVHRLVIISPEGMVAATYERSCYTMRMQGRSPSVKRGRIIDLDIHLKAFASGEFPSRSFSASRRFIVRQSIHRTKKSDAV
jgi:hypothetical protein